MSHVIPITSGKGFRYEELPMPVSRGNINGLATQDPVSFQAFTDLANFVDALEASIGVHVGAGARQPAAPPAAAWSVSAANGHYLVQIANPESGSAPAPLQHQFESATAATFDANAATTTYTLGVGETTRDLVDPGVSKFFRLRSRYPGSAWNSWQLFATAAGVVALASGALKTS